MYPGELILGALSPSKTMRSREDPMTADAPNPPHPMRAMTTYELKDYRRQLERALGDRQVGNAPVGANLRARLDEVLAEQEQRERIRHGRQISL